MTGIAVLRPTAGERREPRPCLYFDLASPYTYLAAERAERMFPQLRWLPARAATLRCPATGDDIARAGIARRAAQLGLPLVWPVASRPLVGAMRVASLASERGTGAAFALAAGRLAFCGGYDLEDPEILSEAAEASDIDLRDMLQAAGDARRDAEMADIGRRLVAAGADRLPVLRMGRTLFCGEHRLPEAAAARAARR